jgi:MFS family permease
VTASATAHAPTATVPSQRDQLRQLSVLMALNCVDMLGFMMVLPLLPFYALNLHATAETVGWMTASFSIAQLVAAPLWGRVSDRYGRRPALMIGLFASGVAYLVFGLASALWLLFLSRIVQGAGGGTTGVAQAYVSDTVPREHRARALGWLSAATSVGVTIGPAIGSLAAHFGAAAPGFFAAGLCFLNVIAAFIWLPESRRGSGKLGGERKPVWHAAVAVLGHPSGQKERLIWIYGVGMLAFSLLTSVLALWLGARFGVNEKNIGYFFVYSGVLAVVMRAWLLGPAVKRLGETGVMRLGTVLLAVGMFLYPLAPSIWWLAVIIPFVPVGTALMFPAVTSLLSHATDPNELGTTMGVAQTFAGIARVVGPIVGTIAFQRIGIWSPFVLGGCVVLLVSWVAFNHLRPAAIAPHGA